MGFDVPTRTFERVYLALLLVSAFGLSSTSECTDFNLTNVNDDGGDWNFYKFPDSTDCFLCCWTMDQCNRQTELALPCMDRLPTKRQIQIWYQFELNPTALWSPIRQDRMPSKVGVGTSCQHDNNPTTDIQVIQLPIYLSNLDSKKPLVRKLDSTISYRLRIKPRRGSYPNDLIVCLTNVTFIETEMPFATTTAVSPATTENKKTNQEQRQSSNFPIWVSFVIIAIVIISICAVVVFIRRRKQHDHQPANNVIAGSVNGNSIGRKENMKNNKDVIANPTYGQEPVNEKEEEYHSYTEIDVKIPDNSEMIYNSAYESPPASSDMVYNSAYESSPSS